MNSFKLTVAVTGVAATENPGPGIGVARSLRDHLGSSVRLVALAYDAAECLALGGEVFDHVFLMPYPGHGGDAFLNRLRDIHRVVPLDRFIPCLDLEIPLLLSRARDLDEMGILCTLPKAASYHMRDKERLEVLAKELPIQLPPTKVVFSASDLPAAIEHLGFPFYVKGNHYGANRVDSLAAAETELIKTLNQWGYPALLQAHRSGIDMLLVGLGNGEGGLVGSVSLRKEHQTAQGKLWNAITVECPWLRETAERFCEVSHWNGPFELECLLDHEGTPWLIEINPRFPAWIHAAAQLGVNLPARLLDAEGPHATPLTDFVPAGKWVVRSIRETVLDHDPMGPLMTEGEVHHAENP